MMISLLTAVFAALAPSTQQPRTPPADGKGLVHLALVADRETVRPGERFTLGVHLKMEPGWHVYWHNPGDSGIPTSAKITAPPGFEVGPIRFPAPVRHELEGDIVSYIHEGDLLLIADAVAPKDLAPGSKARFAVESRWLVCTDVCLGGSGEASFELPVSPATAPEAARANQKLFDAARARAPRPWSEIGARASVTSSGEPRAPVQTLRVRGASGLEFFPDESKTTTLASRTAKSGAAGSTIELAWSFEPLKDADRAETRGVLEVRTGSEVAFYAFDPSAAPGQEKQ